MTEPIKPDQFFIVHANDPEKAEEARVLQALLNAAAKDYIYDLLGIPRPGREPDYIKGRWCVGCHNSLPDDWRGPCDVCGKVNEGFSLDGLMAEDAENASQPLYRGIPRAE